MTVDFKELEKSLGEELELLPKLEVSENPDERAMAAAIKRALDALPYDERDILGMCYIHGKRYMHKGKNGCISVLAEKHKLDYSSVSRKRTVGILHYCICRMAQGGHGYEAAKRQED